MLHLHVCPATYSSFTGRDSIFMILTGLESGWSVKSLQIGTILQ